MYNDNQPTYFPETKRIIVIGDVHGDIGRLMQCFYEAKLLSPNMEWIANPPDTIVVQLGDQIDSLSRGATNDWETLPDLEVLTQMDILDKIASKKGGRVLSLIGNHEIMNVLGEYTYVSMKSKMAYDLTLRNRMFQPGNKLALLLAKRNVVVKIGKNLFCHGGILPEHLDMSNDNLHQINEAMRKFLLNEPIDENYKPSLASIISLEGILWTRHYLNLAQSDPSQLNDILDNVLQRTGCKAIFVGHSTVPLIKDAANGKVFFVDAGLSRAYGTQIFHFLEILTENNVATYNSYAIKNDIN